MQERNQSQSQQEDLRRLALRVQTYYTKVYLSVSAAAKMLNHAVSGIPKQVMGMVQGFYQKGMDGKYAFQITDIVYLPAKASQTRVTADTQTQILMASYADWISRINTHNIIGWYHSHPSYGCWLSGIDVDTSNLFQKMNDPFVAIVIDPIKSLNFQKLDIGAFRVYSNDHKQVTSTQKKDVPRRKLLDLGYHYQRYYQLPIQLYVDDTSKKAIKNIQKFQWSSQLSNSSFFNQLDFLTEAVEQQKLDITEYFLFLNQKPSVDEARKKKISTFKKCSEYIKERNIALLDSAIKTMLF